MSARLLLIVAALVVGFAAASTTRSAAGDVRMQEIMRTKLSNTQGMLKAIVTTDYKEIDRFAAALKRISEAEIVSWQNAPSREYVDQAMLFLTSVDDLREASRRRDIDDVGAAYSVLITTCVQCHQHVRDARVVLLLPSGAHPR